MWVGGEKAMARIAQDRGKNTSNRQTAARTIILAIAAPSMDIYVRE
jgi:hypothetical protein